MPASKDRVKFYYSSGDFRKGREALRDVFSKAFDYSPTDTEMIRGITIICRPSQFGRFIVLRNEAIQNNKLKGVNTVAQHHPEIIPEYDIYEKIANAIGVKKDDVARILQYIDYDPGKSDLPGSAGVFDVSGNFNKYKP